LAAYLESSVNARDNGGVDGRMGAESVVGEAAVKSAVESTVESTVESGEVGN